MTGSVPSRPRHLTPTPYLLGHSPTEVARLQMQADLFADFTEQVLRSAGIGPGMRVLDVGCGVGDVALIAAGLVGPTGAVLGVDRAEAALRTARSRASAAGYDWLSFDSGDIHSLGEAGEFDALTGRFILLYLNNPASVLQDLMGKLRSGGIAAFIEMDIASTTVVPAFPLFERCVRWIVQAYERAGIEPNMGSILFQTFRGAGLNPRLLGAIRVEGSGNTIVPEYLTETLRSLLPSIVEFEIAAEDEIDIDTLGGRLALQAAARDYCFVLPRLIGAWSTNYDR